MIGDHSSLSLHNYLSINSVHLADADNSDDFFLDNAFLGEVESRASP